ncbi:MAG: type II toxin-antitoxin system Phd/YefM family antitoxin [Caenispirillum sp.]|nr:type II toxin-antitoxin system Phd/YefM family antitoxin [Caenispirillum sp.]
MRTWQIQEARSQFSALVDEALEHGPQRITRHGRKAVVVVSEEEWERLSNAVPAFGRMLADCPLEDDDLPTRRPARAVRGGAFE